MSVNVVPVQGLVVVNGPVTILETVPICSFAKVPLNKSYILL